MIVYIRFKSLVIENGIDAFFETSDDYTFLYWDSAAVDHALKDSFLNPYYYSVMIDASPCYHLYAIFSLRKV
jgi:hypothetical protein